MAAKKTIYCSGCAQEVQATLCKGSDLFKRTYKPDEPLWLCIMCGNYVGCHVSTTHATRPLGVIPTEELRQHHITISKKITLISNGGIHPVPWINKQLSKRLGYDFKTSMVHSVQEALRVLNELKKLEAELKPLGVAYR